MVEGEKVKTKPPKGGRKGGTIFPRIALAQAIDYSNNVVRKTHSAPQPAETLYIGVFANKGAGGRVRASALKQYGLLKGDVKGFSATDLSKEIQMATTDQRAGLLRRAFLSSSTFKYIYTTYQGDTVSRARLGQAAATRKVHPESVEECVDLFIQGALTAALATQQGDDVKLISSNEIGTSAMQSIDVTDDDLDTDSKDEKLDQTESDPNSFPKPSVEPAAAVGTGARVDDDPPPPTPKQANVHVNFTVDSSLDADKLQKHLELLRKFGVI